MDFVLIIAYFGANLGLFLLLAWLGTKRGWPRPFAIGAITAGVMISLPFIATGQIGHTWSFASYLGKSIALLFSSLFPVLGAGLPHVPEMGFSRLELRCPLIAVS